MPGHDTRIRILPETVSSQIAAGEVVDRPASVVRELLDNSIDAGADRIIVRIEQGGNRAISVTDNGIGMSRDDILLCVERYATSKIGSADDLFAIETLGFRGEALPSIASVSRMQIVSRPKDMLSGHRLKIRGGKLVSVEETGAPAGTTVEVRDLFFNVPARRKFLRTARTESHYIADVVSRIVLPYPGIYLSLEASGKPIVRVPAAKEVLSRISTLVGRNIAGSMKESEGGGKGFTVRAFFAPSEFSRPRADRLFVYVNHRNVRDRLITRAVLEGYGQRLMKGRYPQAVLFIEIEPSMVDVNVHPAKQEVRFHNGQDIFLAVVSMVKKAFEEICFISGGMESGHRPSFISEPAQEYALHAETVLPGGGEDGREEAAQPLQAVMAEGPQVIGQLKDTYILCQEGDGLLMVDQHAAHERIVYEELKKGFSASGPESQILLVPYQLELSARDTRIALGRMDELSRLGLEMDHFGGNTFLLRSFPAILGDLQWDSLIPELLSEMEKGAGSGDLVFEEAMKVMACHSALRAGHKMSHAEMTRLVTRLAEMDLPTNCPHGRPVFKRITYYEIEKMFKRIV